MSGVGSSQHAQIRRADLSKEKRSVFQAVMSSNLCYVLAWSAQCTPLGQGAEIRSILLLNIDADTGCVRVSIDPDPDPVLAPVLFFDRSFRPEHQDRGLMKVIRCVSPIRISKTSSHTLSPI